MRRITIISAILLIFSSIQAFSTTWDEPWQDSVIIKSDNFIFGKVIKVKKEYLKVQIIRCYGKENVTGIIVIDGYHDMKIGSWSGSAAYEQWFSTYFEKNEFVFFFIKKGKNNNYNLPTPTSGFAGVVKGDVYATYRHSCNKAIIPLDIYEKTMVAIFNYYHSIEYDKDYVRNFVSQQINTKPAGFDESEVKMFFLQHAALECIYHLKLPTDFSLIRPFLIDTSNYHSQISAARALVVNNTKECKVELLKILIDSTQGDLFQVICVWTLQSFHPVELKEYLAEICITASEEWVSFSIGIMDPRIGTHIPTVKDALEQLIANL